MKPQWDDYISQFDEAYKNWKIVYPSLDLQILNFNSIQVRISEFDDWFLNILEMFKFIAKREDLNPMALVAHQSVIFEQINAIQTTIISLPHSPVPNLSAIENYLHTIWTSLTWLTPPGFTKFIGDFVEGTEIISSLNSVQKFTSDLGENKNKIANQLEQLNKYSDSIADKYHQTDSKLNEIIHNVANLYENIINHEREASNAKHNAEANAQAVVNNKTTIDDQLKEISESINRHNTTLKLAEELIEKATLALEGSSKVALAASFNARREKLEKTQRLWIIYFIVGLASFLTIIIFTTNGIISLPPLMSTDGRVDIWATILRFLYTSPSIWLTWFSARQFGLTLRLIEDYAYKES